MAESSIGGGILVVEDDPHFLKLIELALADLDVPVRMVRSGEQALKLCEEARPRVVITDGLLPGMRGDELARRLREQHGPRLPIVFCSAFFRDLKSYHYLMQEVGVNLVLHKPLRAEELRAAISRLPGFDPIEEIEIELEPVQPSPELAELFAEYLAASRERVRAMQAAVAGLGEGAREPLELLRLEGHRFRGSGASFGVPEISRLGGEIEDLLRAAGGPPGSEARARLAGLVDALGAVVVKVAGAGPIAVADPHAAGRVSAMLVDGPGELSASCAAAALAGRPVKVVADPQQAVQLAMERPADVIFVADDRPDADGVGLVARLKSAGAGPVVLLARRPSVESRVRAVRVGASGYVARPADADGLLEVAASYARRRVGASVVAIDDDKLFLELVAGALAPHAISVEPCLDPDELFEVLQRAQPSTILLDLTLPKYGGAELLRVLRADPSWRRVPVVVVSSEGRRKDRALAFEAGADDFVQKPFVAEELAARVLVHVERRLHEDRLEAVDPLSQAVRPRVLREVAERSLALARRAGRTVGLMVFDCDVDEVAAERGPLAAEEVVAALAARLRASFRVSDVVARLAPGRLAVLLHDVSAPDAQRLLEGELEAFRARLFGSGEAAFACGIRGGLAVFPDITGSLEDLLRAATPL